ncbi:MAG: hypothetical protein HPY52_00865 [Firmicutes bacterium]|nr:hypothetical protein [Bacillota bacterium]
MEGGTDDNPVIKQIIGGVVAAPFIFAAAPIGFFVGFAPVIGIFSEDEARYSIMRISDAEYMFLRRIGIREAVVVM